jgi:hypothetical protein
LRKEGWTGLCKALSVNLIKTAGYNVDMSAVFSFFFGFF